MLATSTLARLASTAILFLFCCCLTSCESGPSKLTKANFDKIKNGMSPKEVEDILGEASEHSGDGVNTAAQFGVDAGVASSPGTSDYTWKKGNKTVTVTFKQGRVTGKNSTGL